MNKIVLKMGFIVLCIGGIIFLLLPFLETTSPTFSSLKTSQAQVVSENPLTTIAKRLSSLFARKEQNRRNLAKGAQVSPQQNVSQQRHDFLANLPDYPANTALQSRQPASTVPSSTVKVPAEQVRDYEDASFQTDTGEWVLVRQTAPQSSAPGMHEINVHDNPYDRYVRQERARHFVPQTTQPAIPASKWARLTRPVKAFLGLDDPQPVPTASIQAPKNHEKLTPLGAAQDRLNASATPKSSSYPYMRLPIADITPQQWGALSLPQRERLEQRQAARDFAELLSGQRTAEQAAKLVANALYPNPKNATEKQQKEDLIKRLTAENKQRIREGIMAKILENAADKEPVDELSFMTGCNSSLPTNQGTCRRPGTPPQHEPAAILQQAQEKNVQTFFRDTKFVLPKGLPFIPIVGPTDPSHFQNMADPEAGEIYTSLYNQQKCSTRPCYWVPNSNPSDFKLTDTFTTIGDAKLKTDMYNTYDTFWEGFKQTKLAALGPDATDEDRKRTEKAALKQWKEHRPNWVPWGEEHLLQLNQDNLEVLGSPVDALSDKEVAFPVSTDPAISPDLAQKIGPTSFISNQTSLVNANNPIEAGEQLTNSLAIGVNNIKEETQKIQRSTIQQAFRPTLNRIFTQTNHNGTGFNGALNLIKSLGGANNKTEPTKK